MALIVATAVVSSLSALCISHYVRTHAESQHADSPKETEDEAHNFNAIEDLADSSPSALAKAQNEAQRAKAAYDKCTKISATDFYVGGLKKAQNFFPEYPCGVVKYDNPDPHASKKAMKETAIGEVIATAGVPLRFRATEADFNEAFIHSFIFDKIDPDLFEGLYFEGLHRQVEILPDGLSAPKTKQSSGVIHLFKAASKWNHLTFVSFRKAEITNDLWAAVNELPHMTHFALQEVKFDPVELAHQPFWERLRRFDAMDGDVTATLKRLSKSQKLNMLLLDKEVRFSPESLQSLSSASNLQTLIYNVPKIDDATVDAITHLKQVAHVQFVRGVLSESQIAKTRKVLGVGSKTKCTICSDCRFLRAQEVIIF